MAQNRKRTHMGQLETKHGTTEDKTRDSRRQPVEQQEARRETPGLMNGATKLLCVLASGPPNNSSIPTSPAPRSSCTAHSTQSSCLSRLAANHSAANYDAEERVTTGRGWAYTKGTESERKVLFLLRCCLESSRRGYFIQICHNVDRGLSLSGD